MNVWIEVRADVERDSFRTDLERRLKEVLGVKVAVTPVGSGELDRYTGTSQSSKVKRILDRRS
jgi:phenylacetate-coenzyme A ligase PaaK-like adenylate-forming protein